MKKDDVIREVMSMVGCGYQVAKGIVKLAAEPPSVTRQIGPSGSYARLTGLRRPMTQREADRIVTAARERIALVDQDD